jgi:hypothetical protein
MPGKARLRPFQTSGLNLVLTNGKLRTGRMEHVQRASII